MVEERSWVARPNAIHLQAVKAAIREWVKWHGPDNKST